MPTQGKVDLKPSEVLDSINFTEAEIRDVMPKGVVNAVHVELKIDFEGGFHRW